MVDRVGHVELQVHGRVWLEGQTHRQAAWEVPSYLGGALSGQGEDEGGPIGPEGASPGSSHTQPVARTGAGIRNGELGHSLQGWWQVVGDHGLEALEEQVILTPAEYVETACHVQIFAQTTVGTLKGQPAVL